MPLDLKPITLDDALNDPNPLDFDRPIARIPIAGAVCRSCGFSFLDTNGKRLCDTCLVERVNGAGELEDDDPDDPINQVPHWASEDTRGRWPIVRDYWREEVARNSPALARLERICAARGYDYEATVRTLS